MIALWYEFWIAYELLILVSGFHHVNIFIYATLYFVENMLLFDVR